MNSGPASRRSYAPPPPVAAGFTRLNVVGNLYVDVQGAYPPGYGGKWDGVNAPIGIPVNQIWYVNRGESRSTSQRTATLGTPEGPGPAQFGFGLRTGTCYGDITGTDLPVLLTEAPQTFRLTGLHTLTPNRVSGCASTRDANNFSGTVTLSANRRGDVSVRYDVDVFSAQGRQTFRWQSEEIQLKNGMTPELAIADIQKKKEAAAQRLAYEQAVKARLARKLSPVEARIDAIIREDSQAWVSNRYDVKSVTGAKSVVPSAAAMKGYGLPAGTVHLHGNFTMNEGRPAAVDIMLVKGVVNCVKFSDDSDCRPLGQPASRGMLNGVMSSMMQDMLSGGGSSSTSRQEQDDRNYEKKVEYDQQMERERQSR